MKIFAFTLLFLPFFSICNAGSELHHFYHEVKENETLDIVAIQYITPDRYLPEFEQGIIELNYDSIFQYRKNIEPGDVLEINVWY